MDKKEKTLMATIALNLLLVVMRFYLAAISGSLGMEANAWHSLTDVLVSGVVLSGLIVARVGSGKYKWTIGKIENVLAIFVAVFIFIMGIDLVIDTLGGHGHELEHTGFVAAGALVGVVINYFMAAYKIRMGKETGSQSLIADGYHSKMDMYCSIAVLVGILGSLIGTDFLDKIAAMIAMVFLFSAGYEILSGNVKALFCKSQEECTDHTHQHIDLAQRLKDFYK